MDPESWRDLRLGDVVLNERITWLLIDDVDVATTARKFLCVHARTGVAWEVGDIADFDLQSFYPGVSWQVVAGR